MRVSILTLALSCVLIAALTTQGQAPPARPPADSYLPVYRLYNRQNNDHLYTADAHEMRVVQSQGFEYENVAFYVSPTPGPELVPLYRYLQPPGTHFYTTAPRSGVEGARREGIVGYIAAKPRRGLTALYGWYSPAVNVHFYTTDPNGEWAASNGFEDLGVIGYVIPGG